VWRAIVGNTNDASALVSLMYSKPEPSNATDTDHDITFPAGSYLLTNGTNYKIFNLATEMTKKIDATWAAGTDAGGRASGVALSSSTMYYVQAIGKADGTIDFQFDTSATAANRDSSYSWYGIVRGNFVVFTDGSSNIQQFNIIGNRLEYETQIKDVDDSSLTDDTYETGTLSIPPSSTGLFFGWVAFTENAAISVGDMYVKEPTTAQVKRVLSLRSYANTNELGASFSMPVNASRQMQYKLDVGAGDTADQLIIYTNGYLLTA